MLCSGYAARMCNRVTSSNCGVLKQTKLWGSDTFAGHYLHIHLNPLTWIGHLFVGLKIISHFILCWSKQSRLVYDLEQALWATSIAPLPQAMPQFYHA